MNIVDNLKKGEGGYIFVSHSHNDLDKVRTIRNVLEEYGYEPLCFYLRCLTEDDEVEGLIKREIDSRDIFLYVESENARNSKWVTKERNYISGRKDKTIYTINIDEGDDINENIKELLKRTRVFISYSHKDRYLFERIKNKLIAKDLKVFDDTELSVGSDWEVSIQNNIEFACKYGCFVTLITSNILNSMFARNELLSALKLCKNEDSIIPIFVDDAVTSDYQQIPPEFLELNLIQSPRISADPSDEELEKLANFIRNILVHKVL